MSGVLAIFAAPRADTPEATEFLRVVTALLAVHREVKLVEAGAGFGVLSRPEPRLAEEGERYLDALAANGIVPKPLGDLTAALAGSDGLLRLADPAREGVPAFLEVSGGEDGSPPDLAPFLAAGQVVLAPHLPSR